jgi:signal transduction histidine kinase
MLTEVFQNLLANAAKYTEGGEIMVLAEAVPGAVECCVDDNGEGIPPDRIERIFDKLATDPDPQKQGIGLGLAIVKQAVEAHHGTITVESTPGAGTTFRLVIPVPPEVTPS